MKTLAVSVILAAAFAAPAFAEPPTPAVDTQPPVISDVQYPDLTPPAAPDILPEATTPEARRVQMQRCFGPPMPRKETTVETINKSIEKYAAELAAVEKPAADAPTGR